MERRSIFNTMEADTAGRKLVGYGAVFDSPTTINEGGRSFSEVIRAGSFRKAIESKADIIATFNHDTSRLLGRTGSGTLRLNEDSFGLKFELDLPESAADIRELVQRGDIRGASFTFAPRRGGERWDGNTRELTDLFLYELGPVAMPAYQATSVGLRSRLPLLKLKLVALEKSRLA